MDLSDDLTLPLASGVGYWYWLGGRPAFDFANTLRERWWRNVETLAVPEDLSAWLCEADLLERPAAVTAAQLRAARRLRAAIDDGIVAATRGRAPGARAIAELNRWLARSAATGELVCEPGAAGDGAALPVLRPRAPVDPIEHALHAIARDAAEVLGTDLRSRARVCASGSCSARFFDASRAATRRWCSMRACGNTAKARRHRARAATEASDS